MLAMPEREYKMACAVEMRRKWMVAAADFQKTIDLLYEQDRDTDEIQQIADQWKDGLLNSLQQEYDMTLKEFHFWEWQEEYGDDGRQPPVRTEPPAFSIFSRGPHYLSMIAAKKKRDAKKGPQRR